MSLARTIRKKQLTLLGLNSGTSADGLDMAVVRIRRSDNTVRVKFLAGCERRFSPALRELVLKTADAETVGLEELIELDALLGDFFGRTARSFLRQLNERGVKVDVVASHGQTVRHCPRKVRRLGRWLRGTMQLGSLDRVAGVTGRLTVGDFRQADVAIGGEGAPITTNGMLRLFGDPRRSRLIVNIGGMANYFYFPAKSVGAEVSAADCGPGNSLIDTLCARLFDRPRDTGGRIAASGLVNEELLTLLLADEFFHGRTVSTGRERFGVAMAESIVAFGRRHRLAKADLVATAAELTAQSVAKKLRPLIRRDRGLTSLYLTGGGRRNIFLVERLGRLLSDVTIRMADDLGVDADFIEAAAYAVMGEACLRSEALPASTVSAGVRPVLGRIAQPPVPTGARASGK
jgi:anhydro-N-acetylmuramic acid kinase